MGANCTAIRCVAVVFPRSALPLERYLSRSPCLQSGGTYDLRVSAASSDAPLHDDGVIVVSLGEQALEGRAVAKILLIACLDFRPPSRANGKGLGLRVLGKAEAHDIAERGAVVAGDLPNACRTPGTRYQSYCANISRSYIINPSKDQTAQYNALLAAHEAAIAALKPGAPLTAPGEAVVNTLKAQGQVGARGQMDIVPSSHGHGL